MRYLAALAVLAIVLGPFALIIHFWVHSWIAVHEGIDTLEAMRRAWGPTLLILLGVLLAGGLLEYGVGALEDLADTPPSPARRPEPSRATPAPTERTENNAGEPFDPPAPSRDFYL